MKDPIAELYQIAMSIPQIPGGIKVFRTVYLALLKLHGWTVRPDTTRVLWLLSKNNGPTVLLKVGSSKPLNHVVEGMSYHKATHKFYILLYKRKTVIMRYKCAWVFGAGWDHMREAAKNFALAVYDHE